MSKLLAFALAAFFVLSLLVTPNPAFAQGTYRCILDASTSQCVLHRNNCDPGFVPPANGCSQFNTRPSFCAGPQGNCLPAGVTSGSPGTVPGSPGTVHRCLGGTGILTALGCIPVNNTNNFAAWFLGWAIGVAGGIAFLLILFSGFQIMTAAGDPQKLQSGRELLTAAISGLILIIFSVFLLKLIGVDILNLPGF